MTIHVTAEDIRWGKRRDCAHCPVALAIQRQVDQFATVGRVNFLINDTLIEIPEVVKDWTLAFDDGHQVAPFTFELDIDP